ncbi:hypothetical protein KY336_02440 [Candidatus Woesearchaeota archaeon]|nr:hypothetical protein [Candidatus Woesearchaeota archaeon]
MNWLDQRRKKKLIDRINASYGDQVVHTTPMTDPANRLREYFVNTAPRSAYSNYMGGRGNLAPDYMKRFVRAEHEAGNRKLDAIVDKFVKGQKIFNAVSIIDKAVEFDIAGTKMYVIEFKTTGDQDYRNAHNIKDKKQMTPAVMKRIFADYKIIYDAKQKKVVGFHEEKSYSRGRTPIIPGISHVN